MVYYGLISLNQIANSILQEAEVHFHERCVCLHSHIAIYYLGLVEFPKVEVCPNFQKSVIEGFRKCIKLGTLPNQYGSSKQVQTMDKKYTKRNPFYKILR